MGITTQEIRTGRWRDYSKPAGSQVQYLTTVWWSNFITNFIGIVVTIAAARLLLILLRLFKTSAHSTSTVASQAQQAAVSNVQLQGPPSGSGLIYGIHPQAVSPYYTAPPSSTTAESEGWYRLLDGIRGFWERFQDWRAGHLALPGGQPIHTPPPLLQRIGTWDYWRRWPIEHPNACNVFVGVLWLCLYLGVIAAGIAVANLANGSNVSSSSPYCGLYQRRTDQSRLKNDSFAFGYEATMQVDVGDYANRCYRAEDGTDGCGVFAHRAIEYKITPNASCPFGGEMCYGGPDSAVKFETPPQKASVLGINAPAYWEFKRTSVCSPLVMNESLIQGNFDDKLQQYIWKYYYGATFSFGDHTWITRLSKWVADPSTYSIGPLISGYGEWVPIPALQPPSGATTTIVFVSIGDIYFVEASRDPVFRAETADHVPGENHTFYRYGAGHARPFACVDETVWRDPEGEARWVSFEEEPKLPEDRQSAAGVWLLRFSLYNSNIYTQLSHRSASVLDAQMRITGKSSFGLDPEQWIVEVRRLFEASLARIQFDTQAIARGRGAAYANYERIQQAKGEADFCDNTYVFPGQGWMNINFNAAITTLVLCLAVILIAIPWDEDRFWTQALWAVLKQTTIAQNIWEGLAAVWRFLAHYASHGWKHLEGVYRAVSEPLWELLGL